MKIEQVPLITTTPLNAPPYNQYRTEFRNREYFTITYETDMDRLLEVVPEPLEISAPLVRFEFMNMPDSTGLGSYMECGQLIPVTFNGEEGVFSLGMYVDNFPAIAAGREVSAYPKKPAKPSVYTDSDTIVTKLAYGTLDVAIGTMGYKCVRMSLQEAEKEIGAPQYMLKLMRDYRGRLLQCELTRMRITKFEIREAWRSPARLQLFEHVSAPLADLPVRRVTGSTHILTDLKLSPCEPVFDYLKK